MQLGLAYSWQSWSPVQWIKDEDEGVSLDTKIKADLVFEINNNLEDEENFNFLSCVLNISHILSLKQNPFIKP